jgi:hypothetical protein
MTEQMSAASPEDHKPLRVHSDPAQLLQCAQPARHDGALEQEQHEECEYAVVPVLVHAPEGHTEHLQMGMENLERAFS